MKTGSEISSSGLTRLDLFLLDSSTVVASLAVRLRPNLGLRSGDVFASVALRSRLRARRSSALEFCVRIDSRVAYCVSICAK